MSEQLPIFQRALVLAHPKVADAFQEAVQIASSLEDLGIPSVTGQLYDEELHRRVGEKEFDLLVALGGDGTMLRAGHLGSQNGIPVLGINMGRFGFLMEVKKNQWREMIPRLANGDYWLENRMMLNAEQWRHENLLGRWDVLNEVVVSRGQIVRPVHIITSVDGRFLTTFVADGLIASTPTGSTAYALAAGGPILPPELRNILIVPIAPHLSPDRAIVLAEGSFISINIHTDHQAVLSIDGQPPVDLTNEDRVDVRAGEHTVHFVRFGDPGYFYRNLTPHMNQNPSTGNSR